MGDGIGVASDPSSVLKYGDTIIGDALHQIHNLTQISTATVIFVITTLPANVSSGQRSTNEA